MGVRCVERIRRRLAVGPGALDDECPLHLSLRLLNRIGARSG